MFWLQHGWCHGSLLQVETVDNPPNSRSTMYYQLSAFVDEVRACEVLPVDQRAKSWTYSLKPSPVSISSQCAFHMCGVSIKTLTRLPSDLVVQSDAVANMAVVDDIYRVAGMAPRRTTATLPPPSSATTTTVIHPDGTSVVVSTTGGAAL